MKKIVEEVKGEGLEKLLELKKRIAKYPAHTPLVWELAELIDMLIEENTHSRRRNDKTI